jgi:hypothetical protein
MCVCDQNSKFFFNNLKKKFYYYFFLFFKIPNRQTMNYLSSSANKFLKKSKLAPHIYLIDQFYKIFLFFWRKDLKNMSLTQFMSSSASSSTDYKYETLLVTNPSEYVFHVEFNRPEKRNAMNFSFFRWTTKGDWWKSISFFDSRAFNRRLSI